MCAVQALLLKAQVQAAHAPERTPELTTPTVQLLRSCPTDFHALATAAEILGTSGLSGTALPESDMLVSTFQSQHKVHLTNRTCCECCEHRASN